MNISKAINLISRRFTNKKGFELGLGFIITAAIILLLIITILIFIGDSSSGIRELIRNIFG